MKFNLLSSLLALFVSLAAAAQKDELKLLKKILDKDEPSVKDITEYKNTLVKVIGMEASLTEGDKVYFSFYKTITPILEMGLPENRNNPILFLSTLTPEKMVAMVQAANKVLDYEKVSGKEQHTADIKELFQVFKPMLINMAIELGKAKEFKKAAMVFYAVYEMDKKEQDNLFYAASYAVNGEDYNSALAYYDELKALNYSGEGTIYFAKNKATGVEESFATISDRDQYVKLGTHKEPRNEKIPSRRGEIYKNVALILINQNKIEQAKAAISEARQLNPDDDSLMLEEANLYLKLSDYDRYKIIVSELLQKNPTNADLVYNLAVITSNSDKKMAETYYLRTIEINPQYTNAYLNLAILKLEPEKAIIDEMNTLGTSEKDNKRYEVLKKQREVIFKGALPYLEKAQELDPANEQVYQTLYNVYGALEMDDARKSLKQRTGK